MKLITELRKNDGQLDYEYLLENLHEYERALKTLYKNKEWEVLYKALKSYRDNFDKFIHEEGIYYYRPGMDFIVSFYAFYLYAKMMEKGIKGVIEKDKAESIYAYLHLLRRYYQLPNNYKHLLHEKDYLLLGYAYPDMMDNYSQALYEVGSYYYKKKNYARAFKFFKKGADFNCDGRQIVYPYYLIGKNQDKVGDMYKHGLGVKQNERKAWSYYNKCAQNCGKHYHPKIGDMQYERKEYAKALLCYTDVNPHRPWRYSLYFMQPNRIDIKMKKIFSVLNNKKNRTKIETEVLSIMYQVGLGCEKDEIKGKSLLPNEPRWVSEWISDYQKVM